MNRAAAYRTRTVARTHGTPVRARRANKLDVVVERRPISAFGQMPRVRSRASATAGQLFQHEYQKADRDDEHCDEAAERDQGQGIGAKDQTVQIHRCLHVLTGIPITERPDVPVSPMQRHERSGESDRWAIHVSSFSDIKICE